MVWRSAFQEIRTQADEDSSLGTSLGKRFGLKQRIYSNNHNSFRSILVLLHRMTKFGCYKVPNEGLPTQTRMKWLVAIVLYFSLGQELVDGKKLTLHKIESRKSVRGKSRSVIL